MLVVHLTIARRTVAGLTIVLLALLMAGCGTHAGKGAGTGALAGLWLEILNYADSGQESKARALFPTLVKQDWNIETTTQAETKMREGVTALGDIREKYDLPRVCAT
jgi:hypothetical protein